MLDSIRDSFKKAFSRKLTWVAMVAIPLIAGLFGLLYVATFDDPYGRLEELPVAIVNRDFGTVVDGEPVNYGSELADSILEDDSVAWEEFDGELEGSDYSMGIVIPEDFSERVAAGKTREPERAGITFYHNVRKNFMLSVLSSRVESQLDIIVNEEVGKQYTESLAQGLQDAGGGLEDGAEGAREVNEGAEKLADGAGALADGADTLKDGLAEIESGASELDAGADKLSAEASKIPDGTLALAQGVDSTKKGIDEAAGAAGKLSSGADALSDGSSKLETALSSALEGAKELEGALGDGGALSQGTSAAVAFAEGSTSMAAQAQEALGGAVALIRAGQYEQAVSVLEGAQGSISAYGAKAEAALEAAKGTHSGLAAAAEGASTLRSGMTQMEESASKLSDGADAVSSGAAELAQGLGAGATALASISDGAETLQSGAVALSEGANSLSGGASSLSDGAASAASGASELADGAREAEDGANQLADGSSELAEALGEGADEISESLTATPKAYADYISAPVEVEDEAWGDVGDFGHGFAPLFMTISLWLGSLLIFFIFEPFPSYARISDSRAHAIFGRWPLYLVLAVLNAVVVCAGSVMLGVPHAETTAYVLMFAVCAFSFMCVMQFLNLFDIPGKAVAVLLVIFQIVCCSGTFPATLGQPYASAIAPWLPFTYAIDGFREAMSGNAPTVAFQDMGLLLVFALLGVCLSLIAYPRALKMKKRRDEDLVASITAYEGSHVSKAKRKRRLLLAKR